MITKHVITIIIIIIISIKNIIILQPVFVPPFCCVAFPMSRYISAMAAPWQLRGFVVHSGETRQDSTSLHDVFS